MLAGLQLTSLGALGLAQWPRLLVAVVGLGAALTGVGYVVHRASRILTDDWITLAQLSLAEFRGKLEQSDRLEGLFDDVETYREEVAIQDPRALSDLAWVGVLVGVST